MQNSVNRRRASPAVALPALTERQALAVLAVTGVLTVLVYALVFTGPYSLFKLYHNPHVDIYAMAQRFPYFREKIIGGFIALAFLYLVGWRMALRVKSSDAWVIVIWTALMSAAVLLLLYPFGSTDIFDYILGARVQVIYHGNPFVDTPGTFPWDPFYPYVGWPGATSAYGPIWQQLAAIVARIPGNGIIANVVAFKALSGIFLGATVTLVALLLRRFDSKRALAGVLLLAWNPVVLYQTLGMGHNDMIMVFFMVAAVWAITEKRYTLSILAIVAGALVKYIPVLMLPAAGLIALRDLPNLRARTRFLIVTTLAALALVVFAFNPYWDGLGVLSISRRTHMFTESLPTLIYYELLNHHMAVNKAAKLVSDAAAGLTFLYAMWEGLRAWRDRSWRSLARTGFNVSVVYALITALWFMPWYVLWPLAFAPLLLDGHAHAPRIAQLAALSTVLLRFVIEPAVFWGQAHTSLWQTRFIVPGLYGLPWMYLMVAAGILLASRVTALGHRVAAARTTMPALQPSVRAMERKDAPPPPLRRPAEPAEEPEPVYVREP